MQLCLFSSTPDMDGLDFVVKVLTGHPKELGQRALAWGYDGIEFMPNPENIPDPCEIEATLRATGAVMPVVNTGRMFPQGMALFHQDKEIRKQSVDAFKKMLDFAGYFRARVGLGIARGSGIPGASREETDHMADDIFREIAVHAESVAATIMLEPADPGSTSYINTVDEAMAWVDRISSPAFTVMLDTYQLAEVERSIGEGIRAARGHAQHIHLYDLSRWPPGVLPEKGRLDWPYIACLLREEGFRGSGSVVIAPEGDPEPAARKAVTFLRQLFNQNGD
jgi:sugar phosphate isomerase/epimerase